jgi:hypothetical protein
MKHPCRVCSRAAVDVIGGGTKHKRPVLALYCCEDHPFTPEERLLVLDSFRKARDGTPNLGVAVGQNGST